MRIRGEVGSGKILIAGRVGQGSVKPWVAKELSRSAEIEPVDAKELFERARRQLGSGLAALSVVVTAIDAGWVHDSIISL